MSNAFSESATLPSEPLMLGSKSGLFGSGLRGLTDDFGDAATLQKNGMGPDPCVSPTPDSGAPEAGAFSKIILILHT